MTIYVHTTVEQPEEYIIPGKRYLFAPDPYYDGAGTIASGLNEENDCLICLTKCAHLNGGDWIKEEWNEWTGSGEQPVPDGVAIDCITRDGHYYEGQLIVSWYHMHGTLDVVAWRFTDD